MPPFLSNEQNFISIDRKKVMFFDLQLSDTRRTKISVRSPDIFLFSFFSRSRLAPIPFIFDSEWWIDLNKTRLTNLK